MLLGKDNIMVQHHSCQMPPVSPAMMPPEASDRGTDDIATLLLRF